MIISMLWLVALVSACQTAAYLDGPHVPIANEHSKASQWWYFDFVADEGPLALQMVFYSGFPFGHIVPVPYYAQISYTLPNGTVESEFAVSPGPISFAQTTPSGYSSGSWPGIGGFLSTESGYIINFQGESVSGEIIMDAVAPPHYPCSMFDNPALFVGPSLGWTNAIPGSRGSAHLTVRGKTYRMTGVGYHDSNFVPRALPSFVHQYIWGHGTAGGYTFAFFNYLPKGYSNMDRNDPNAWFTSGYLSHNGEVISNFCSLEQTPDERQETRFKVSLSGGIWGKSPKEITLPDNSTVGVDLSFMIGSDTYSFDISSTYVALAGNEAIPYLRWTSKVRGGHENLEQFEGVGYLDIMKYGESPKKDENPTAQQVPL